MSDITGAELEKAIPLADQRISNILNAVVGRVPSSDEKESAYKTLQGMFGVDFDEALKEYVKYQRSNPFVKKIKDIAIKGAVTLNKGSYIDSFMKNLDQSNFYAEHALMQNPTGYNAELIQKMHKMAQQPGFADQIVKNIMDYRDLSKPLPFVNSQIRYPTTNQQQ